MKRNVALLLFVFLSIMASGQNAAFYAKEKYSVDNQINNQLKRFTSNDSGVLRNAMFIQVDMNDHLFLDHYSDPLDCYTQSVLSNDTVVITGHIYGEFGYGFLITLFKDSCILTSFAYSDSTIYKHNKTDTDLLEFIAVPSTTQKLVLANRPVYKEGDIISGFVELESKEFYYGLSKPENRFRIKLKAHFRTSPLNHIR